MITPEQLSKSGSEHGEQSALFQWAVLNRQRYPQLRWLFAVPNGFYGTAAQKGKMKAEGLKIGCPDVWLPVPICDELGEYLDCGLVIEMKLEKYRNHKDGGCSQEQIEWLDYLSGAGYKAVVCYGWQEAVKVIEEYLNG